MKSQDQSSSLDRKTSVDRLEFLVKYNEIIELKRIIEESTPADLTLDSGMTLLHLAAQHNNTNIIAFLLESGYDVNAVNSSGITPLMLAVFFNNYEAVKLLLDADAKILTTNTEDEVAFNTLVSRKIMTTKAVFGEYLRKLNAVGNKAQPVKALSATAGKELFVIDIVKNLTFQEFMIKKQLALVLLIKYFMENMEFDYDVIDDEVPEILLEHLSIDCFVILNSKQIIRTMIEGRSAIGNKECKILMEIAVKLADAETMEMLLSHGPNKSVQKQSFVNVLFSMIDKGDDESLRALDFLLQHLAKFNVIDDTNLNGLSGSFKEGNSGVVRLFLKHEINAYVQKTFCCEILVDIFSNGNVDVTDLLQNRKFNVNARNHKGLTGLHLAMSSSSERNVRFLLDRGADPNITSHDDRKETPLLYHPFHVPSVKLLLQHGADIQVTDNGGHTIIDKFFIQNYLRVDLSLKFILAQLALNESRNVPLRSQIKPQIDENRKLATFYFECQTDIKWLKAQTIFKSITFYSVLTCQPENIAYFVCTMRFVYKILDFFINQLKTYYYVILREKLEKAFEICQLRRVAVKFLAEKTDLSKYFDCWTLDHMIRFLSNEDLLAFAEKA